MIDLDDYPDPPEGGTPRRRGRHRAEPTSRPWTQRPRLLAAVAVAVAAAASGIAILVPIASARLQDDGPDNRAGGPGNGVQTDRSAEQSESETGRTLVAGPVTMEFDGFFSWALLDNQQRMTGSANLAEKTWAGSILKVWIVSDYLRRTAEQHKEPSKTRLAEASRAIRDSNDQATEVLYTAAGGQAQLQRMITICGLTDTNVGGPHWRSLRISARDAARLGACVADGRAAGPKWTTWVRNEMTMVRGSLAAVDQPYGGRWGIIDGLPADLREQGVGIINGWIVFKSENEWQVNCLAAADTWALAVLLRYSTTRTLDYGAEACAKVAAQLAGGPA